MTPAASIVTPSFRGAQRLPRLLRALEQQTTTDWEAVVVIDGDVDGSEQVLDRYSGLPIRPVILPENRGRVAALNAGLEAARGDVLIRCDDDLEPASTFVANHLRHHNGPAVGVVGLCRNRLPDNRYARVYGDDAEQRHADWARKLDADQRWRLWAANCSLRRDTWKATGPYDVRYRAYGWEDMDYGYRLHKGAVPIVLDRDLEVDHHAAATSTRSRVSRAFLSGEARQLFDEIHGPGISRQPHPTSKSMWDHAVDTLAAHLTNDRSRRLATIVDAALPRLPAPVGRKAAALAIEAAGLAGYRNSDGDQRTA